MTHANDNRPHGTADTSPHLPATPARRSCPPPHRTAPAAPNRQRPRPDRGPARPHAAADRRLASAISGPLRRAALATMASASVTATAAAVEFVPEARAVIANSTGGDTDPAWTFLFDAYIGGSVEHEFELRDKVLTTGAQLRLRLVQNVASRPGFAAARFGEACVDCGLYLGETMRVPTSPTTGAAAFGPALTGGTRFSADRARVWLAGFWGEIYGGYDIGAAELLDARPRRLFAEIGSFSGALDPTGLDIVRSANDLSGTAPKIGYTSPRVLGLKAGLSWAPGVGDGITRTRPPDGDTHATPTLINIVELGLSFARRFYTGGVRTRLGITYATAGDISGYAEYGRYHAAGIGLEIEYQDIHWGLRWLYSNNALASGARAYNGIETGLSAKLGPWHFGAEFGWSDDQLTGISGLTYVIGVSFEVTEYMQIGLGWLSGQADLPRINAPTRRLMGSGPGLELELRLP